jgi:hypothetical protein
MVACACSDCEAAACCLFSLCDSQSTGLGASAKRPSGSQPTFTTCSASATSTAALFVSLSGRD